jgi:hypothetical protein
VAKWGVLLGAWMTVSAGVCLLLARFFVRAARGEAHEQPAAAAPATRKTARSKSAANKRGSRPQAS